MRSITIRNIKFDKTPEISIRDTYIWGKRCKKRVPVLWIASPKMPIDSTSELYERLVYRIPILVFDMKSSDSLDIDIEIGKTMGSIQVTGTVSTLYDSRCTEHFSVNDILESIQDYLVSDAIVVITASDSYRTKSYTFNLAGAKIKLKKDRTVTVYGAFSLNDSLDIDGFCKSFETIASIDKKEE